MSKPLTSFFFYVVVGLQMLTTVVSAQGLMRCVHADGLARIESRVQQEACASHQDGPPAAPAAHADAAGSAKDCQDVPVADPRTASADSGRNGSAFDPVQALAILPAILRVPDETVALTFDDSGAPRVPNAALRALTRVILVI